MTDHSRPNTLLVLKKIIIFYYIFTVNHCVYAIPNDTQI